MSRKVAKTTAGIIAGVVLLVACLALRTGVVVATYAIAASAGVVVANIAGVVFAIAAFGMLYALVEGAVVVLDNLL